MTKKLLSIIALLCLTVSSAWADNSCGDGVTWSLSGGTLTISYSGSGTGAMADYSWLHNQPWYSNKESITSVIIENGVTSIGNYAFDSFKAIASVTVPTSVTSIGEGAFYNCSSLATYSGGSGVTNIGGSAFQDCGSLTSFTIPSGVTEIKAYAFKKSGLTSITIPDGVTKISPDAFMGCGSLTSVTIPSGVTSITDNPFSECNKLSAITVDVNNQNYKSVERVLFSKNGETLIAYPQGKGTTYTIPAGVTSIGNSAFQGCSGLTSFTIPDGVTSIGNNAFQGCSGLTSFTIPSGVTSIGEYAFQDCSGLTSFTIPSGVTSIGNNAFNGCSDLTSVTVYAPNCSLGGEAFDWCASGLKIYVFSDKKLEYEAAENWKTYTIAAIPALTVNDAGEKGKWCTYYNGLADVTVADGTTVYTAKYNSTTQKVTLTETGSNIIKKGEAVLLKASADITLSSAYYEGDGDYWDNELQGTDAPTAAPANAYCLSGYNGSPLGFYAFTGTIPANRAYLVIPSSASARTYYSFADDATAIENLTPAVVEEEGDVYDLSGRRVAGQPQKGIYVKNGNKIVIK